MVPQRKWWFYQHQKVGFTDFTNIKKWHVKAKKIWNYSLNSADTGDWSTDHGGSSNKTKDSGKKVLLYKWTRGLAKSKHKGIEVVIPCYTVIPLYPYGFILSLVSWPMLVDQKHMTIIRKNQKDDDRSFTSERDHANLWLQIWVEIGVATDPQDIFDPSQDDYYCLMLPQNPVSTRKMQ